jgi:hypothetical protein
MKKISLIFVFIGLFNSISAQELVPENGPVMTFESTEVDYGEMAQGDDGTKYFVFTNTGNEPLIISNVRSSCGCTVPTYDKSPIAPGDESIIEVKYDTKRVGPFRKTITLFTNVPDQKVVVLRIKGNVKKK